MSNDTRYTVIGAGHGGKAMAADLAAKGFAVTLYNRTVERAEKLARRSGVDPGIVLATGRTKMEALDGAEGAAPEEPLHGDPDAIR